MPRRRYRLFIICAAVICFMLYRVLLNSWDEPPSYAPVRFADEDTGAQDHTHVVQRPPSNPPPPPNDENTFVKEKPLVEDKKPTADGGAHGATNPSGTGPSSEGEDDPEVNQGSSTRPDQNSAVKVPDPEVEADTETGSGTSEQVTDNAAAGSNAEQYQSEGQPLQWQNPPNDASGNTPNDGESMAPKIHWKKPKEHFPVPTESVIPLPTGQPKTIPRIQYDFPAESDNARAKRVLRQRMVRDAISRAWSGYRKFAWMHDELSPVSGKFRDPFCGWSATLVDAMDTLWIAGLKDEFDDAAKGVANIDFTYTIKSSIPVFETTIRYLGGLLAAFDVSGGKSGAYPILLEKAVELGEVLMGIFDTPNRMPVLYYHWQPDATSQPRRAGRVGVAELATLSMEFTRLAQLTGEDKYYDAVARITDALVELQEAGTTIPGLFPENLDASGCNRTATTLRDTVSPEAQTQVDAEGLPLNPLGYSPNDPRLEAGSGGGVSVDDRIQRRDGTSGSISSESDGVSTIEDSTTPSIPQPPFTANGQTEGWDCVPQGLVGSGFGFETYHMGGAQDSAYEYFPKEWLLLGGLEPKYQKLHEDTIDAINEWLMFRPMLKGDWDVLFPAKVTTNGQPQRDLMPKFEVTHLTCFIGGMFALGGKIFGRDEDIETAKQLTDGCVWAYGATPSGIMPEGSEVVACPTLEKCEFNETLWYESLDPSKDWRTKELEDWEAAENVLTGGLTGQRANEHRDNAPYQVPSTEAAVDGQEEPRGGVLSSISRDDAIKTITESRKNNKRAAGESSTHDADDESELPDSLKNKLRLNQEHKDGETQESGETTASEDGDSSEVDDESSAEEPPTVPSYQPTRTQGARQKPLSHEEFVSERLAREKLPPGFLSIDSAQYILRPEAIESVWYMYRITGDPAWMEKGWTMFEATMQATKTEWANSAIRNVLDDEPELSDEMESFWLSETLKYYYLLFSEPHVISLDEWVLNTEAHPFRRPT
ncbi:hypothetical protein S40288_02162 [Stachybotrys chartarum IBT 40288]|nr:hypothetical protein S40288_02162 [Stachybotrys chartarum IBT 40288]